MVCHLIAVNTVSATEIKTSIVGPSAGDCPFATVPRRISEETNDKQVSQSRCDGDNESQEHEDLKHDDGDERHNYSAPHEDMSGCPRFL